ncbi:MAG: TetR/AcrR family transcriptional regulator [Pseudomonadota bacterium]
MGRPSNARDRLLDSAVALIHSRSYESVGVQELCEHAGVKKGSFYHFFPSKEALTVALLEHRWSVFREQLRREVMDPSCEPLARVRRFVMMHAQAQVTLRDDCGRTPGCCFGNLAAELSTLSEPVRCKLEMVFAEQTALLEQVLDEAVVAGAIREIDVPDGARAIVAFVQGTLMLSKLHNRPEMVEELADHALALVRAGVDETISDRARPRSPA